MAEDLSAFKPFDGDGRYKRTPMVPLPNTEPMAVTNAQARLIINQFQRAGRTNHSGSGSTLWVTLLWCQTHNIPYRLSALPGVGYVMEQFDPGLAREKIHRRGPADGC